MSINSHGLKRKIPNEVKAEIRQRCGFGCVICGKAIYQYDHFAPEFADAKIHDPNGITLLCGSCHDEKTRGFLDNSQIANANDDPFCMKHGNAFGRIRLTSGIPKIALGSCTMENCAVFLEIGHEKVIWVRRSTDPTSGFLFNANLRDEHGNVILKIVDNEWQTTNESWDVETTGNGILVRSRPRKISLVIRIVPPDTLKIERADLLHRGQKLLIQKNGDLIAGNGALFHAVSITNFHTAIRLREGQIAIGCGPSTYAALMQALRKTTALVAPTLLSTTGRKKLRF